MPTKSQSPYIAPEGVSSDHSAALSEIPPPKDSSLNGAKPLFVIDDLSSSKTPASAPPAESPPDVELTDAQKQSQALANLYVAYTELYAACQTLIRRARPANKLKHNYFVCAEDLENVVLNMDGRIANALSQTPTQEDKT
jgi:hypothetical protein